ncbi:MAG: Trypsin-like peptidase domain [Bacillales bacterium]|jgi:V8-like Glu-specific endopeptidase|nr:Trypsin-like peptidase domain [Bacillales bacterium]
MFKKLLLSKIFIVAITTLCFSTNTLAAEYTKETDKTDDVQSVSVVKINRCYQIEKDRFCAYGTGVIVDDNHLITNYHVAHGLKKNATNITLTFDLLVETPWKKGDFTYKEKIALTNAYDDEEHDLSVLKFDTQFKFFQYDLDFKDRIKILPIADKNLSVCDKVTIKGFPSGVFGISEGEVTEMYRGSYFAGKEDIVRYSHRLTNKVEKGSSGSPVLNENNEIVAIANASTKEWTAIVLDISHIKDAIAHIEK